MALPVENTEQLSIGGFQGIKKIQGLLVDIDVTDPPETWENRTKQVVKVSMEDTVVLEMFGDEDPMNLKDGKYSFYIPYVEAGKSPSANSIYSKCWLESAKELGKLPSEFIGEVVTLEKQGRKLFDKYLVEEGADGKPKVKLDEEGKKMTEPILAVSQNGLPKYFCFVGETDSGSDDIKAHIISLITGLNDKAALRKLLTDPKAKQFPEYKDKLNSGSIAEYLGLAVVDGLFVTEETDEDSSS